MLKKVFLLIVLFCFISTTVISQNLNQSWQIGVGFGITKFSKSEASFIGDQYLFQIPRVNLTIPIGKRFSIDGGLSFNTFGIGFISNSVKYFSMDGSVRYNLNAIFGKFSPYVFAGGSLVDSERKMTPTLNVGIGGIYWINNKIGINPQLYYKHSFENFESMRSHLQGVLGVVFNLDWGRTLMGGSSRGRSSKKDNIHCF